MRRFPCVRVITKKRLDEAIKANSGWGAPLRAWFKVTKAAKWANFQEVRDTFNTADKVGTCVVFDIGGNKCRLIAYIRYTAKRLYILHILSHADYDKDGWKNDCDCN